MTSRPSCPHCLRPTRACLCHGVRTVASAVQLLVLQHPLEVGHAKNTARLLHLCVPGSRLEVGERFEDAALNHLLHAPWPHQPADAVVRPILLYPPTPVDPQLPVVQPPPLPPQWLAKPAHLRLVVIDGTWRKSRKMLYVNPGLQQLPRLPLHDVPQGRYAIRKAHAPGQLSSFEAAALALAQLHSWDTCHPQWQSLQHSFEAAMALHHTLHQAGQT